jgi:hypothetical protein
MKLVTSKQNIIFALVIFTLTFLFFYFIKDDFALEIYQGRDLERAIALFKGVPIFWGPETSGGGVLPGPLYYIILGIPIWFTGNAFSSQLSLCLTISLSIVFFSFFGPKANRPVVLLLILLCFIANPQAMDLTIEFYNPSFLWIFTSASLLAYTLFISKSQKRYLLLSALILGLGCQVHMSIIAVFFAILLHLFWVYRVPWKRLAMILTVGFLIPSLPFILHKFILSVENYQINQAGEFINILEWFKMLPKELIVWRQKKILLKEISYGIWRLFKDQLFYDFSSSIITSFLIFTLILRKKKIFSKYDKLIVSLLIFQIPAITWQIVHPDWDSRYLIVFYSVVILCSGRSLYLLLKFYPRFFNWALFLISLSSPLIYVNKIFTFFFFILAITLFFVNLKLLQEVKLMIAVLLFVFLKAADFYYERGLMQNSLNIKQGKIVTSCFHAKPYRDKFEPGGRPFNLIRTLKGFTPLFNRLGVTRENLLVVGMSNETEVGLYLSKNKVIKPEFYGYVLLNVGHFCKEKEYEIFEIMDLLQGSKELPTEVKKGLISKEIIANIEGKSDHLILVSLLYTKKFGNKPSYQNVGRPYLPLLEYQTYSTNDLSNLITTLRLNPKSILIWIKNCERLVCLNGVRIDLIADTMKVSVFGAPLSQTGALLNPYWTEYWGKFNVNMTCNNNEKKSITVVERLGLGPYFNGENILAPFTKIQKITDCNSPKLNSISIQGRQAYIITTPTRVDDLKINLEAL